MQESLKSALTDMYQSQTNSNNNLSQLQRFIQIFNKPPQSRTHKQISNLLEYIPQNKGLHQLQQKVSMKFVKNLLFKYSEIIYFNKGSVIAEQGEKINKFYIVLNGKIMSNKPILQLDNGHQKFEKLGIIAHNEIKANNKLKKRKIVKKPSKQLNLQQLNIKKPNKVYNQHDLYEVHSIGIYDRSMGTKYLSDFVVTEKAFVVEIQLYGFLSALAHYVDEKVKNLYSQIHHYPCFAGLDTQLIQNFIVALSQKKKRRGTYIYRQNQPIHSIYLLSSGQIKLTKQSNLFEEDPNNLYANRLDLLLQNKKQQKSKPRYLLKQQQMLKAQATLPYANLSLMYNFSPKKKTIQISRLHSFCIFGGEQLIQSKKRQTNAICNSLQVIYYQIQITKIQQILGNKNMQNFMKGLKLQVKDKVLHRQLNFANTMHFENTTNLNYFYYEGQNQNKSNHKFRITKLNNKIQQSNKLIHHYSLDARQTITPQFTAFNFNKLQKLSLNKSPEKYNKAQQNPQNTNTKMDSDDQIAQVVHQPSDDQMKIITVTHTWKLIKKKVDDQVIKSQKLSAKRYTIDVNDPLIDNKFFTNLDIQKRKLQRKIRKDRITLGQSRAISTIQKRTINL